MNRAAMTPAVLFSMRLFGAGAALGVNLLLAKHVSPEQLGTILAMISLAVLCSTLPFLTLDSGAIRFIRHYLASGNESAIRGYLRFLLGVNLSVAVIAVIILSTVAFSMHHQGNISNFWQWSPLVPASFLFAWMRFRAQVANAKGDVIRASIGRSFVRPVVFLGGLILILVLKIEINPLNISLVFLIAISCATILQHKLIEKLPNLSRSCVAFRKEWVTGGLSIGANLAFQEYMVEILIVIAALTLQSHDVAIFAIALRLAAFARYAIMAVDQSNYPKIARHLAETNMKMVVNVLNASSKMRLGFAIIAVFGLLICTSIIEFYLGGIFTDVLPLMPIVLIEIFVFAILGSPQFILGQTEGASILIHTTLASLLLIGFGTYMSGELFGLIGVVWAISIILSARLLVLFILSYRRTSLNCSIIPFRKMEAI